MAKAVLKPLGLTQADLARKLQISTRQLDNWAADPRPDQLERIVVNLRREPEWRDAFAARLQSCVAAQQPVPAQAAPASDGTPLPLALPEDVETLARTDPSRLEALRRDLRDQIQRAFAQGQRIIGFDRETRRYILSR